MRTFRKTKAFNTSSTGATGGKNNEAILFVCGGAGTTITVQSLHPNGSLVPVGPISLTANQALLYPAFAYGWTSGAAVNAYELF